VPVSTFALSGAPAHAADGCYDRLSDDGLGAVTNRGRKDADLEDATLRFLRGGLPGGRLKLCGSMWRVGLRLQRNGRNLVATASADSRVDHHLDRESLAGLPSKASSSCARLSTLPVWRRE
jgi:hypothetical protein